MKTLKTMCWCLALVGSLLVGCDDDETTKTTDGGQKFDKVVLVDTSVTDTQAITDIPQTTDAVPEADGQETKNDGAKIDGVTGDGLITQDAITQVD